MMILFTYKSIPSSICLPCIGSSLQVFSAFRLAESAKKSGAYLVAINVGPTRADRFLDMKLQTIAGETVMKLATHECLLGFKT